MNIEKGRRRRRILFGGNHRGPIMPRLRMAFLNMLWWALLILWIAGGLYLTACVPFTGFKSMAITAGLILGGAGLLVVPGLMVISNRRKNIEEMWISSLTPSTPPTKIDEVEVKEVPAEDSIELEEKEEKEEN